MAHRAAPTDVFLVWINPRSNWIFSSAIVYSRPDQEAALRKQLTQLAGVEVHADNNREAVALYETIERLPGAQALTQAATPRMDCVRWDKGVCRFCGTGYGGLIGTKDKRIVATQGDPDAPVNKGLASRAIF